MWHARHWKNHHHTAIVFVSESPIALNTSTFGDLVKEKSLHEGYDPEWRSCTMDDDKGEVSA